MAEKKEKKDRQDKKKGKDPKPKAAPAPTAAEQFLSRRRRAAAEEEPPVSLWLITFTDIMALMLTFFVLLYSMAVPQEEKWDEMTSMLNRQFNKFYSPEWYSGPQDTISIDKLDFSRALDLNYLQTLVLEIIAGDERLKETVLIRQKDRLVISLPSDLLFETGKSEVLTRGKRALFVLGEPLSRIRNRIEVVGHADPRPVTGGAFDSNWALSLSRASHVAGVLEDVGYTRPVTVRGLSSARYDELPESLPEEERLGLARRVDIVIMKDDGSQRFVTGVGDSG